MGGEPDAAPARDVRELLRELARALPHAREPRAWQRYRRSILVIAFDAAMVIAIVVAGSTVGGRLFARLGTRSRLSRSLQLVAIAAAATPFTLGIVRDRRVAGPPARHRDGPGRRRRSISDAPRAARSSSRSSSPSRSSILLPVVAAIQPFVPASVVLLVVIAVGRGDRGQTLAPRLRGARGGEQRLDPRDARPARCAGSARAGRNDPAWLRRHGHVRGPGGWKRRRSLARRARAFARAPGRPSSRSHARARTSRCRRPPNRCTRVMCSLSPVGR